jgi:hypothetical protein
MTWDQRVAKVQLHGFTERQAGFLVTVMLHAGVCLQRHYSAFAGIAHGRKVCDFFDSLVGRGYATASPCGHHRARVFHVHYKPLYRDIGEPENRNRRPATLPRVIERLMLLDAVMADPGPRWLSTEQEKLGYFTLNFRTTRDDLPSLTFRAEEAETVRYFPDKLPIGIEQDGRTHTFLYLVTRDVPMEFRGFLERHAELLRALPAWTIRLLVPMHKREAVSLHEAAFREHFASPLRPIVVEDLRWYFKERMRRSNEAEERFDEAARAFGAPRFQAMYRAWIERGDSILEGAMSTTLTEGIERGVGRLERVVLEHQYAHLYALAGTA